MENVKSEFYKENYFGKPSFSRNELLTRDDLNNFKCQMLFEIKNLLKEFAGHATKKWIKSKEVRKLLNISPGTLQNLRNSGTIPFSKLGGSILYDPEWIQKVIESKRVSGGNCGYNEQKQQ